jgi:hypothetical protein
MENPPKSEAGWRQSARGGLETPETIDEISVLHAESETATAPTIMTKNQRRIGPSKA